MLIVRATRKLLRLVGPPTTEHDEPSTTLLGPWHATVLFWRPQIGLLVNDMTLLPLLMPLAPARTLPARVGDQIATVLTAHHAPRAVIEKELQHMQDCRLAPTTNRSVIGVMNDFARLATLHRDDNPDLDPLELAVRLANTPCSPLYRTNISPDRELAATLHTRTHERPAINADSADDAHPARKSKPAV